MIEGRTLRKVLTIAIAAILFATSAPRAADTLPAKIADDTFWGLISTMSETTGTFASENFISNEVGFQKVLPALQQATRPGGAYLGVGPEQNFTYIVALKPSIAFVVDIRRQNMIEHLVYKAAFEFSDNRADFLARLFSRKRPAGLSDSSTARELLAAYSAVPQDDAALRSNLQELRDPLVKKHQFGLTDNDLAGIERVHTVFGYYGTGITYNSSYPVSARPAGTAATAAMMPSCADVMSATDPQGKERSYLATEENYAFIRNMQMKNLLIPLVGDFGGPKALRAVGQFLKNHGAIVTAFYTSNVEQYLFGSRLGNVNNVNGGSTNFYDSVATLPLDPSSTFIRSSGSVQGAPPGRAGMYNPSLLSSIQETLVAVKNGRIQSFSDVLSLSR